MLENLNTVVFSNADTDLDDMDSDIVTFCRDGTGLVAIDFNNINLGDDNFDEDNPANIVLVRLMA